MTDEKIDAKAIVTKTMEVIKWRLDADSPEMIQAHGYTKGHMLLPGCSVEDLNHIADITNAAFRASGSRLRVDCSTKGVLPTKYVGDKE